MLFSKIAMLFKKNKPSVTNSKDIGTVIGKGITLDNVIIKGIGYVRVDGTVNGDIQLEGHLILGEEGRISGAIHAGSALFFGVYQGNISVEETLRLAAGSHVDGNIKAGRLVIDDGADFHGTCNMDISKMDSRKIISLMKKDAVPELEGADVAL